MQLLYSLATNLRLNEFYQHKCWRKVKFKAACMSNHGNRILNLHMRVFVSKVLCKLGQCGKRDTTVSQLANRNSETQLEFQISPTYSKPPSRVEKKGM